MAIGWLTVLQSVPWADVVSNAPKMAEGARRLWELIGRKGPDAATTADRTTLPADDPQQARLAQRLAAVEAHCTQLQEQLQASSALIKALAEQNEQLVRRIEANRSRVLWLATAVAVALSITALLWHGPG
ncbi:hypothetical protein C7444_10393 [Sphaerotilus hippei]|uniref:Uncharacterized protein n=1 Tax=Sphaerotilus hippei TaxID=744406 RepID=A0A318H825_9BURK|nr:hypothetical protein [Sphaerotilus hippei]PXW98002.1 hypothetical protein C7444_10393 [Sphaerotilus hippei]